MDIISFNEAATANGRIEKFIKNPDSNSGIVTVPKVIGAGESVTIPAGRVAVLPNVQVVGEIVVETGGEIFIPAGTTLSKVVELDGDQEIAGIKTFSSSPIVPTPTNGNQAATKQYVDDLSASLSPVIISGQVGTQTNVPAGKIHFGEIWVNTGGISYNSTTRRFTVPKSGTYRITMNPFKQLSASSARVLVGINTDTPTAAAHKGHTYANGDVYSTMNINSVVNLSANDYIVFYLGEGELYNASTDKFNQFTIERIA